MLFNVIGYSNEIIGQVEANNPVEAWSEAGKRFENVLDVRQVKAKYNFSYVKEAEKPQIKLYHTSPRKDLTILYPTMPAEDIIQGKTIPPFGDDVILPESSKCVSFAGDLEQNFHYNPIIKGYIYEPLTDEVPRPIWEESPTDPSDPGWTDFRITKEYRFYKPVPVKMTGEFEMKPTTEGLEPIVKWYDGNLLGKEFGNNVI